MEKLYNMKLNLSLGMLTMMAVLGNTDPACACDYTADFSEPDGADCLGTECGEDCGDECGVDSCSVVVCLASVAAYTTVDCDAAVPTSGQVDSFTLASGQQANLFYSIDDTMVPTTTEAVDDSDVCTIDESITGRGKTGPQQLCWMRKNKRKQIVHFVIDSCNRLRAYGLEGGYKLTNIVETPGGGDATTCGITYTFTNTTKGGFKFVDYAGMGHASPEAFLNTLLTPAP